MLSMVSNVIKGILWDNDGVLVNTEPIFYEANRQIFAAHGIQLTESDFANWFLSGNSGGWHLLRERGYAEDEIGLVRIARDQRYGELLASADNLVNPGIEQLLSVLGSVFSMGVVTNAWASHFNQIHSNSRLLPYFDVILTRECFPSAKPAPDGYLRGLEKLGLEATECVAIEDSPRGALAARAAGIKCIVLRNELNAQCTFDRDFLFVDSLSVLYEELSSLAKHSGYSLGRARVKLC